MSQENVELVRGALASMAAGDREAALTFFDPEVVVDATRNVMNPATFVGEEGLRRMVAATEEAWEEIRTVPLEFLDAGDRVVVIGELVGRGKGSGIEVKRPTAQIWTVRNGQVVRWEYGFKDRIDALAAAGLRE